MLKKKFSRESNLKGFINGGFSEEKHDFGLKPQERGNSASDSQHHETSLKPLSYISLFQYSTKCERTWILFGILLAVLSGCVPPAINVLYGEFSNMLIDRQYPTEFPSTKTYLLEWFGGGRTLQNASEGERREALKEDSRAWGLGCALFTFFQLVTSMISVFLLNFMAAQQISRIKILFFKSIVCKDMAWFDTQMEGNFAGKASDNLNQLEAGIGGIIGIFAYLMVIFAFGVLIPFYYGWKLTLAILSAIPISFGTSSVVAKVICYSRPHSCWNLFLTETGIGGLLTVFIYQLAIAVVSLIVGFLKGWLLSLVLVTFNIPLFVSAIIKSKVQSKLAVREMAYYTKAGSIAEEVFSSIRTVVAFEGEKKEVERYAKDLEESKSCAIRIGMVNGISSGVLWFIIYVSYAVAFAYGIRLVQASKENGNDEYTPAGLLIVFFGILTALTNIGYASAHVETFSVARAAAAAVFQVINTKPKINPCSHEGSTGDDCNGEIEFRNVHFEYPSRPRLKILNGINLKIRAGEVVAIVGGSGAGKSTILQLVQRLYDPSQGEILLDGKNVKFLKVSWLRQQLGVVGQEPLLFGTTIRKNISYGLHSATDEDVIRAAKDANAHDFIMKLKENYNTVVGEKGSTLSGGQKQRIAIARALIRAPKILLLDEATSALDASSEKIVQAALDRAAEGRTTLIVTHKLSTIVNADRIIVLENGAVAEEGTHSELVNANGIYKRLLQSQNQNVKERKKPDAEVAATPTVFEDTTTILPPGPRSRYSTLSTFSIMSRESATRFPDKFQKERKISYVEIIKWNMNEWHFLVVGSFAAIIGGTALPIVCVLFGSLFGLLSIADFDLMLQQADLYAVILVVVGVMAGICVFLQNYCFTVAGTRMTTRLRVKAFDRMIRQEIAWFDDERNKVGALCLRLSKDPSGVQGAVGSRLGVLMQAFSTMTIGVVLSFFFDWKITLVTLISIPFVFSGVYAESVFLRGSNRSDSKAMEKASKIAVEVIRNVKAVASLGKEAFFIEKYSRAVREGKSSNLKRAWLKGFAFAIGQTAPFFGYAVSLWYGGMLVADENLQYKYVIMVSEMLIFGAWTLGQCVVLVPNFGDARAAAGRLKYIFLRTPHVTDGENSSHPTLDEDGFIKYSKVHFSYPTRPGTEVLRDFNVLIKGGQSVAIMGPSGSGKSTVIQLLQRFYDPNSGTVSINNVNIAEYKLPSLRRRLGLVSQEPVLFDRTIHENIAYGDNSREVPVGEVTEAAKAANIHSFITTLPLGYETKLGAAGTQLSGGQKQRIAIARALVRNPEILLLDEATSALDPESEGVVQDALDKASAGRTTVTVAHRLGAVRNADLIHVVEKGRIRESGSHEELMRLRGLYYSMHENDDERNRAATSTK